MGPGGYLALFTISKILKTKARLDIGGHARSHAPFPTIARQLPKYYYRIYYSYPTVPAEVIKPKR